MSFIYLFLQVYLKKKYKCFFIIIKILTNLASQLN